MPQAAIPNMKITETPTGCIYQIDNGVPIPNRRKNPELYEIAFKMEVGQSFLVDKQRSPITNNLAKATGFKFVQKAEGKDKTRIWRVK